MEWRKNLNRISQTCPVPWSGNFARTSAGRFPLMLFLASFLLNFFLFAQGKAQEPNHTLNKQKWEQLVKDKSYYEKIPEKKSKPINTPQVSVGSGFLKVFFFGVVILILVLVLLHFLNVPVFRGKVKKRTFDIFNPDEGDIHEADLERMLRVALQDGQYKLAIRLYYLIIIRELSSRKFIHWAKDKTNREYLNEMRPTKHYSPFRELTHIFERIWYGSGEVNAEHFEKIDPEFRNFIQLLKK